MNLKELHDLIGRLLAERPESGDWRSYAETCCDTLPIEAVVIEHHNLAAPIVLLSHSAWTNQYREVVSSTTANNL